MREFLYLNPELVNQFLAQAEDGLYDEQSEREKTTGDRKAGASLGVSGAKAEGGIGRAQESELSRTRRQTPESRFNRLAKLAATLPEDEFSEINPESENIYSLLEPGRLVAVDCYLDIPSIGRIFAEPGQVEGVFQMMKLFAPEQLDAESEKMIEGIKALSGGSGNAIVGTGEVDEGQPIVVFKLDKLNMRVSTVDDLEGEVTVFGTVARRWPEGESYPILAVPGLGMLSRKERREMQKSGKPTAPEGDAVVPGPGASISVVAIYRS